VSLQGSLDTFALSDVLTLLATTAKSGELRVAGPRLEGRLWLAGGELASASAGRATAPVDVLFELLRLPEGTFVFADGIPTVDGPPVPVAPVLEEAGRRLESWREIEAVVPSLDVRVQLVPELSGADVVVTAERWRALVAVAEGGVVGVVAETLGLGEFDACSAVKELVDAGLVTVAATPEVDAGDDVVFETVAGFETIEPVDAFDDDDDEVDEVHVAGVFEASDEDDAFDPIGALEAAVPVLDEPADAGDEVDSVEAGAEVALLSADHLAAMAALADGPLAVATADRDAIDGGAEVGASEPGELDDLHEVDEPINRGLLLKFLSSVRN
jgi:hypothetical protein